MKLFICGALTTLMLTVPVFAGTQKMEESNQNAAMEEGTQRMEEESKKVESTTEKKVDEAQMQQAPESESDHMDSATPSEKLDE